MASSQRLLPKVLQSPSMTSFSQRTEIRRCFCNLPSSVRTARTDVNKGWKFFGCAKYGKKEVTSKQGVVAKAKKSEEWYKMAAIETLSVLIVCIGVVMINMGTGQLINVGTGQLAP